MTWMVVGLGNPGKRYEGTRHNAGFLVVDHLASRWQIARLDPQLGSLVGQGSFGGQGVILVEPQGFMNRSGAPTRAAMERHGVAASQVLVVHDDLDIPFGRIRLKAGGGHGGHNGLRDLNEQIGSDYPRLRVGIDRPAKGADLADYVLDSFPPGESGQLGALLDLACSAVEVVIRDGLQAAMNLFHVREKQNRAAGASEPDNSNPSLAPVAAGVY